MKIIRILLTGVLIILFSISQASAAEMTLAKQWQSSIYGAGIGASQFNFADIDADGIPEQIFGGGSGFGGNVFWSIQKFNPTSNTYNISWQSDSYVQVISQIYTYQITGGAWRTLVATANTVEIWNPATQTMDNSITVSGISSVTKFLIADIRNNGQNELIILSANQIDIYDAQTLTLLTTLAYGGTDIAIGNVDTDADLEIVINNGQVLHHKNDITTVKWASSSTFGTHISLYDVDNDNMAEIIGSQSWRAINAYDVDLQSSQWQIATSHDIHDLLLADTNNDQVPELIYADGQWGSIHALDIMTRSELWSIRNPEHGVTDVKILDADGDNQLEVIWGAGHTSTGADFMFVYDLQTRVAEWQSVDNTGPFNAVDMGDIDNDGDIEIVYISSKSNSSYDNGIITIVDAKTHAVEWTSPASLMGNSLTGIHDVKIADVDNDNLNELIIGTDRLYDGVVYVVDGTSHALKATYNYDSGSPIYDIEVLDIDNDGENEIIAAAGKAHTGSPGIFVYLIDGKTGVVEWQSTSIAQLWSNSYSLEVGNIDSDSDLEIVVSIANLAIIDPVDQSTRLSVVSNYTGLALHDYDADGIDEIIVGNSQSGVLNEINPTDFTETAKGSACLTATLGVETYNAGNLFVTCSNTVGVYDIINQATLWTETKSNSPGNSDAIAVKNISGINHVVIGSTNGAVLYKDVSNNTLPTVTGGSYSTHWNAPVSAQLTATDADSDPLKFFVSQAPQYGSISFTDPNNGIFNYVPTGAYIGIDQFTVYVSDGVGQSMPVTINITLENNVPVGTEDNLSVHWSGSLNDQLAGEDSDGDTLSYVINTQPANGVIQLDSQTGSFTYTPTSTSADSDSFGYIVSDGASQSVEETIYIAITNNIPTGSVGKLLTVGTQEIHSRLNGVDLDGDLLIFEVVLLPENGQLEYETDSGLFVYKANEGFIGEDEFQYRIFDGYSYSSEITVVINVSDRSIADEISAGSLSWSILFLMLWSAFKYARLRIIN